MSDKNNYELFLGTLLSVASKPQVCRMLEYTQHHGNAAYVHCFNVAVISYLIARHLHWKIDEASLARGAMLHDFHLYTRQDTNVSGFKHLLNHPKLALANAMHEFSLNEKEKNIIRSHMWPVTIFQLPKSKEAFLVTLADKYCAALEMAGRMHEKLPV